MTHSSFISIFADDGYYGGDDGAGFGHEILGEFLEQIEGQSEVVENYSVGEA